MSRQEAIKQRIARAFEPFVKSFIGSMVVEPGLQPDGPFAEESKRMVEERRESRVPTSLFYVADFVEFVITFPIWGTLLVIALAEGYFDED